MKNERCENANDCYFKITKELTKDGLEASKKMEQYEQTNNKCVLEDTTLRTRRTFVGLDTEKEEYKRLVSEEKKGCVH